MAMNKRTLALLASSSLLVASPLLAQKWGRGSTPRDGVCFYEDAEYRGDYFCVNAGDSISSMPPGMNDRISSIKIFGRAEVTVFKDIRYEGKSTRFGRDVRNLGDEGWNDKVSSLEVRRGGQHGRSDDKRYSADHRSSPHGMTRSRAEEIVRRAYRAVLDREPDPGSQGYVERVYRDGWTQQDVERDLRKSDEYRKKHH
jgi:hypothetical protein